MLVGFMFVFVRPVCEDFIRNKFVKTDAMLPLPCPILGRNFFKLILAEANWQRLLQTWHLKANWQSPSPCLLLQTCSQPCTRQKGTFRFFVEGKFSILGRRARALRPLLSLLPFQSEGQKLQGKIGLGTSIKHVFCPRTLIKNVFAVGHYNSTSICCWTL